MRRGLVKRRAYAYVALTLLPFIMSGAALLGFVAYYHASQASQRAQGAAFEQKLCATLSRLAALQPPPGPFTGNPSRAYLQQEHAVLAELGPDVGCGGKR